jgi:hypothetical protein
VVGQQRRLSGEAVTTGTGEVTGRYAEVHRAFAPGMRVVVAFEDNDDGAAFDTRTGCKPGARGTVQDRRFVCPPEWRPWAVLVRLDEGETNDGNAARLIHSEWLRPLNVVETLAEIEDMNDARQNDERQSGKVMNVDSFVVTPESHMDHGMTGDQRSFVLTALERVTRSVTVKVGALKEGETCGFAICEIALPAEMGTVPCALLGPKTGGKPIAESEVFHATRGKRPNTSRLTRLPSVPSNMMTAIIVKGVLVTLYGGPLAPQEPNDPYLDPKDKPASDDFWSTHALSAEAFGL